MGGLPSIAVLYDNVWVLDRPQPPVNVTVRCEATTAEIEWSPGFDSNDEITNYTLYYSSSQPVHVSLYHSVEANVTSTFVPVRPWLNYTFSIQACNEIGWSDASESVYCTTGQMTPFHHPHKVCTQNRLSSQLVIVWQVHFTSGHNNFDSVQCCGSSFMIFRLMHHLTAKMMNQTVNFLDFSQQVRLILITDETQVGMQLHTFRFICQKAKLAISNVHTK